MKSFWLTVAVRESKKRGLFSVVGFAVSIAMLIAFGWVHLLLQPIRQKDLTFSPGLGYNYDG